MHILNFLNGSILWYIMWQPSSMFEVVVLKDVYHSGYNGFMQFDPLNSKSQLGKQ